MSRTAHPTTVICLHNDGFEASLEPCKVYRCLEKVKLGPKEALLRVCDESGEEYWYPEALFIAIEVPVAVKKVMREQALAAA